MAKKRMNTYIINLRWKLPDGTFLNRSIAENGLTISSAKKKVLTHYNKKSMIKRLGKPIFVGAYSKPY